MNFLIAMTFTLVSAFTTAAMASETIEGAKKDYAAVKAEAADQLTALDKKIDEMKASMSKKSTAAQEKTLKEAEETRAKLKSEYESMKDSTGAGWQSFKKKVGQTLDRLNTKAQGALKD